MGWPTAAPGQQGASFVPSPGNFFAVCYCCFILAVKGKCPESLVELNLGLTNIPESSILSCTHIIHLITITYSMNYANCDRGGARNFPTGVGSSDEGLKYGFQGTINSKNL